MEADLKQIILDYRKRQIREAYGIGLVRDLWNQRFRRASIILRQGGTQEQRQLLIEGELTDLFYDAVIKGLEDEEVANLKDQYLPFAVEKLADDRDLRREVIKAARNVVDPEMWTWCWTEGVYYSAERLAYKTIEFLMRMIDAVDNMDITPGITYEDIVRARYEGMEDTRFSPLFLYESGSSGVKSIAIEKQVLEYRIADEMLKRSGLDQKAIEDYNYVLWFFYWRQNRIIARDAEGILGNVNSGKYRSNLKPGELQLCF